MEGRCTFWFKIMIDIIRSYGVELIVVTAWLVFRFSKTDEKVFSKPTIWWELPFSLYICLLSTELFPNLAAYIFNFSKVKIFLEINNFTILNLSLIFIWFFINVVYLRLFWFCLLVAAKNSHKYKILNWRYYVIVSHIAGWLIYSRLNSSTEDTVIVAGILISIEMVFFLWLMNLYQKEIGSASLGLE